MPTPWKSVLTSVPLWALLAAHCGETWGFYTLLIQAPTYLSNILHFDLNENGLLSALPNLMLSTVSIFASILADHLRKKGIRISMIRKTLNTIGFIGPAICLAIVAFVGCKPVVIVALLCLALGLNGFAFSGFIATHVDMSPDFAGTLYGFTNFFANCNGFIVPAFVGWIIHDGVIV
ncbi:putative inorganic phosphate cotransporter [Trichonephila clavata]|uniref:Putative inorganic phosphate cotransporter n=1 Tax=Trichonephila clavata TaxID=2740835 RepID=A0A8X6FQX5_TRICU|nr:putative inorganic phosphate cotransporter [Trichonephila clavata]